MENCEYVIEPSGQGSDCAPIAGDWRDIAENM
jgi:hypothetical protein